MPPLPTPSDPTPRLIVYHQSHHNPSGDAIPLGPLLDTQLTHLILAAIHLNRDEVNPHITLNDHHPSDSRNDGLWTEIKRIQDGGIKVLGMLGGAARGSFEVLDYDFHISTMEGRGGEERFETYYALLHGMIKEHSLDGLDLDVEENFSLPGCIRLIDRLKKDFGHGFIITLAPVASALFSRDPRANMSGFDYLQLERLRGGSVSWYNAQFYNGWGSCIGPQHYFAVLAAGFDKRKVVLGCLTNQGNGGSGFVELGTLAETVLHIGEVVGGMDQGREGGWGGVMGWELFNAGDGKWLEWLGVLGAVMGVDRPAARKCEDGNEDRSGLKPNEGEQKVLAGADRDEGEAQRPDEFEYSSD